MSKTYKIDKQTNLQWPRQCVVCGLPEIVSEKAYGSSIDDIALPYGVMWKVSEHTLSLLYPLCIKHKRSWLVTRFALYGLVLFTAVSVAYLFEAFPNYSGALWIAAAIMSAGFIFLAVTLPPVRVFRIRDNHYMLRIRNDSYAANLEHANAEKLGP